MKFGKAFSDNVFVEGKNQHRFAVKEDAWWLGAGRTLFFASVFCIAMFILVWRLFHLTVIEGHMYRVLADGNKTKELIHHAQRGIITDRTGRPLVRNIPLYRLLKPCKNSTELCSSKISREEGEQLEKNGFPPGWFLETDYERQYLYPESTAHVIGYVGEIAKEELSNPYYQLRQYKSGDRIGRMGAEAVFEERLRGRDGRELVEIDATGKILRTLGSEPQIPGEMISLSLDIGLSQAAAKAFPPDGTGAIIVSKPDTGEVLTLFSSPSFSPNTLTLGMSTQAYESLVADPNNPLFFRAIGGAYPPGSIFKIVVALAGFDAKTLTSKTLVEDTGVITIGDFSFPNWYFKQYGKTEGMVDIVKAIARSNDVFFYKIGEAMGISKLVSFAKTIGLGKPLGIELSGEASGLMPDPDWKAQRFSTSEDQKAGNDAWYVGDTYHVSIGQGYLLTTPLQANSWTNIVANGGSECRPTIENKKNQKCQDLHIPKESIALVMKGMVQACSPGGTGWPLFDFGVRKMKTDDGRMIATTSGELTRIPIACKTGTAEFGDPKDRTHAWFTAFAPVPDGTGQAPSPSNTVITGDPEISVTVLIEGAGEGSDKAAPVAKKIFEEWFER